MPGMWDMHGHFGLSDGVLNIAGGITSVRDIGGVHEKTMELTAKFDSGEVIGPNTYRAGFMDKAGPFASGWAAESLEDALNRVDFYAENGYIQIKLYSSIEPEWVAPIAERAQSHGMRLSGHIPAFMSAEQAVRAGYNEIQHINMVFLNFLAGDREDTREQIRFTLYGDEAGNLDLASDEVEDFIALLKENNVVIDATAAIFETMLIHLPGDPDPTFAAVAEHLPPAIGRSLYNPEFDIRQTVETWGRSNVNQGAMLKKLHDNGIQLVPGSDNMAAFTVHRELEIYAESGISNSDVLRIATLDSARVVGVADRTGSITVGKDSDLILIALPIYNFTVPGALKAWIDLVCRAGVTFKYTETGPVGLLEGKRAIVAVASGGTPVGSEIDFATGYMRHILGFIGITDVSFVSADQQGSKGEAAVNEAQQEIDALAA